MTPPPWLEPALTILFGALAGGLTNTVAIWMLFHPYRPPKWFGKEWTAIQGAIPKNQPRLASAIGRTVGGRLLTEEDLTRTFGNPDFRAAFDRRLETFVDDALHTERGSLLSLLPESARPHLEEVVDEVVAAGLGRFDEYLDSDDFERSIRDRTGEWIEAIADQPVAGLLTPAREEALTGAVDDWLEGAVESEGFQRAVNDYLDRGARRLLEPGRNFEQVLPQGLVGALEKGIAGYLPLAIHRLGGLLDDPSARARFETAIHDLLQRFMKDLRFHQRVVARLVVTEETVDRVIDTIQEEGAQRLSEMLRDQAVQDAMARGVNDAIVDFLRKPVTSVLGEAEDEPVVDARETLAHWVVDAARDEQTRAFLVEKLQQALGKAGARTWGDLLERVPPEQVAGWLVSAARSEPARTVYEESARRLIRNLLERPIGRPSDWLPESAVKRIESGLSDPLWGWLQAQVPSVVEQLDVARRVEEKVLEFPTAKMEELVRKVTDRELKQIVRLGYLLGAIIGAGLVGIDALFPG